MSLDKRDFEWTFEARDLELLRQAAHRFIPALRQDIERLNDEELAARLVDVMKAGGAVAIMRRRIDEFAVKGVNSLADLLSASRGYSQEKDSRALRPTGGPTRG